MSTNDLLLAISLTGIGVCTLIRCIINASDWIPDLLAKHRKHNPLHKHGRG
ncbi:hypothetical protein [Bifidobacterium pseudolongum]|uniref:hypothetical protein n=1 Tax=Bifidobacterium pseudolongum TaxID=1694 RepID=UPI0010E684B7|nr:hypothetical protein [Bifidobacterium pseudolongum]RYQ56939.1 hypothetical protein PG1616B_1020 [Bifidobacterium pseudolongum subsp. globosum]